MSIPIDQLTSDDFAQLAPGALSIEHQGERLPASVTELRELPAGSPRSRPFALVISGPTQPLLPQGMHALHHPAHGRMELFMVPIGRNASGTRYEIIFN